MPLRGSGQDTHSAVKNLIRRSHLKYSFLTVSLIALGYFIARPAFGTTSVSIPVGNAPIQLAVNSTTNLVYVSNLTGNSVSVIDGNSNSVTATIPLSGSPRGIDVNPTTNTIYVAVSGSVVAINGNDNSVSATLAGLSAYEVAVDAARNLIYAPGYNPVAGSFVSVIDGATNTVTSSIPVGKGAYGVALDPSVISGATNAVTNTFTLPQYAAPGIITLDQKSNRLYVTDGFNLVVYVVNAATGKAVYTKGGTPPITSPTYATILQPGRTVLISDDGRADCVWELAESTNKTGRSLSGLSGAEGTAINSTTHKIYVANSGNSTVSVFSY
jgi:YVTN family beta-propeller protein